MRHEEPTAPLDLLEHDHARIEALYEALMDAVRVDAREAVLQLWAVLERSLLGHMDAEERWVLPAFARVDPVEAAALIEEHGKLRSRLADLGVGVELHAIPEGVATGFAEVLRAHARRENALLHRWIEENAHLAPIGRHAQDSRGS